MRTSRAITVANFFFELAFVAIRFCASARGSLVFVCLNIRSAEEWQFEFLLLIRLWLGRATDPPTPALT
jgi:hypothetical protein